MPKISTFQRSIRVRNLHHRAHQMPTVTTHLTIFSVGVWTGILAMLPIVTVRVSLIFRIQTISLIARFIDILVQQGPLSNFFSVRIAQL